MSVGALLYLYAAQNQIAIPTVNDVPRTDLLFPEIAFHHLEIIPAITFLLGLTAATFATTDSALTALTTSFCVDFLHMDKAENQHSPEKQVRIRHQVHLGFSFLMFLVIVLFNILNDESVVKMIFKVASYTYGPLLGLYGFGLFMKTKTVNNRWVPLVCMMAPLLCWGMTTYAKELFGAYQFDNELIIINGLLTFVGLLFISKPAVGQTRF